MRRSFAVAVLIGVLVASVALPAEAAKKKKRVKPVKPPATITKIEEVVEVPYEGPNIGVTTPVRSAGVCLVDQSMPFHCLSAYPGNSETAKFLRIEVADATGQKVGGFISQGDIDGDGINDGYAPFCGAHKEPVELANPGAAVSISIYAGVCRDGTAVSIVTKGVIKATFSNIP